MIGKIQYVKEWSVIFYSYFYYVIYLLSFLLLPSSLSLSLSLSLSTPLYPLALTPLLYSYTHPLTLSLLCSLPLFNAATNTGTGSNGSIVGGVPSYLIVGGLVMLSLSKVRKKIVKKDQSK